MKLTKNETLNSIIIGAAGSLLAAVITFALSKLSGLPSVPVPAWLFATAVAGPIVYYFAKKRMAVHTIVIANQNFSCDRVVLDGKRFIECDFDRVTLIFNGDRPFGLERCTFTAPSFSFEKHAGLTSMQMSIMMADPTFRDMIDHLLAQNANNHRMHPSRGA